MHASNSALTSSAKSVLIVNNSLHYVLPCGIGANVVRNFHIRKRKRKIFADKKKEKELLPRENLCATPLYSLLREMRLTEGLSFKNI